MSGGVQPPEATSEASGLIARALDLVRLHLPDRHEAIRHLEEAAKALEEPAQGIPPERLSSANDG